MPPQRSQTSKRLRGYRTFNDLFTKGHTIQAGSLRGFFRFQKNAASGAVVGFAVSRNIKLATARNRVKRLLRAAWRRVEPLAQEKCRKNQVKVDLVILYTGGNGQGKHKSADITTGVTSLAEKLFAHIERKL